MERIHFSENCGSNNQTIFYIPEKNIFEIGDFKGDYKSTCEIINMRYSGYEAEKYISKLHQAIDGIEIEANLFWLLEHPNKKVRLFLANKGYGLETFVRDKEFEIRLAVAKQGYGLSILVNDKIWCVREIVANQGYGLDILINDENWVVRFAVANQGYGLNILVNDESWIVRFAVAKQGYGLSILVNDENKEVRALAKKILKKINLTNKI